MEEEEEEEEEEEDVEEDSYSDLWLYPHKGTDIVAAALLSAVTGGHQITAASLPQTDSPCQQTPSEIQEEE